jgi:hypothetical protein
MAKKITETKEKMGFFKIVGIVFVIFFLLNLSGVFVQVEDYQVDDDGKIYIPIAEIRTDIEFDTVDEYTSEKEILILDELGKNEYYSGDSFSIDYFEMIVTNFEYGVFDEIETSSGNTLLKLQLDIKNKAKVRKDFLLSNFVIINSRGEKYGPRIDANIHSDKYMKNHISLGASEQVRTYLLFELPRYGEYKLKITGDNTKTYRTVHLKKSGEKRSETVQKFEELVIEDLAYTVKFVTKTGTIGEYSKIYADGNFVTVNLEVSNKYGRSPINMPNLKVKLLDDEGYSYSEDSEHELYLEKPYVYWRDNEIQPRSKEDYNFLFEIPYKSNPSEFTIESSGWNNIERIVVDVTKSYTKY